MVVAHVFYEPHRIRFPVFRKAFEILKHRCYTAFFKERDSVIGVLVEVRVENTLILEVRVAIDFKQQPSQEVQFYRCEKGRIGFDRFLQRVTMRFVSQPIAPVLSSQ